MINARISLSERNFSLLETYGADESFITGTFGAHTTVVAIDGRPISDGPGPLTVRIRELHKDLVARNTA